MHPIANRTFETPRLCLEPLVEEHARELHELLTDDRMYTFIPQDPPQSMEALADRYRFLEARQSPAGTEHWLNWALRLKATGRLVGAVQATIGSNRAAQLAYEVGVPYWRQGLASEACGRLVRALFDDAEVGEIRAEVDTRNVASIRLLEGMGFCRGALRRNADHFKGSASDEWTYTLARPDAPHRER
jgi:[ribosomal protein S5]-alanine N-acetyltransferase